MSELHRFGINAETTDKQWREAVEKMLLALITNPHLNVGTSNSEIIFPPTPIPRAGTNGGGSVSAEGAFFTLYVDGSGDTYLQGGTVTAGDETKTIADIKVIDSGTGPEQAAGVHMYVDAEGDGVVEDGVLLPGFNLVPANTSIAYNSTIPANTLPTAAAETGKKCRVDLGVFTASGFLPSNIGNVAIYYCPGAYTVRRT